MKLNDRIEVVWIDYAHTASWVDEIDLHPKDIICSSMGYFYAETKTLLIMSAMRGLNDTQRDAIWIPKGMIKEIRNLGVIK